MKIITFRKWKNIILLYISKINLHKKELKKGIIRIEIISLVSLLFFFL